MRLDLRSATEWRSYYSGLYEDTLPALLPLLTDGVVLDVGANIGFYTIPMARRLQEIGGLCIAFEPIPSNFMRLLENIEANRVGKSVRTFQLALGERDGEITMLLDTNEGAVTGNAVRVPCTVFDQGQRERSPLTVPLRRLDDLIEELGLNQRPCGFIKVDIEGGEPLFLRGAVRVIERHRPLALMEINPVWLACNNLGIDDYLDVLKPQYYDSLLWSRRGWQKLSSLADVKKLTRINSVLFVPRDASAYWQRRAQNCKPAAKGC
jgi:FkbM family methyltransferase